MFFAWPFGEALPRLPLGGGTLTRARSSTIVRAMNGLDPICGICREIIR
jgi:hypothetical protein